MSCRLTGAATPAIASPSGVVQLRVGRPRAQEPGDRRALEQAVGQRHVEVVALDLPAAANDPAGRKVEPAGAPADLDLLAVGQPVALLVQRVLQHDADVLELPVEVGGRREAEAEPHQLRRGDVEVEGADDQRAGERARAGPAPRGPPSRPRRSGSRASRPARSRTPQPRRRERMRHVADLVAFADPDDVAEVVGDDAEVVTVVVDVGGQERPVAPAENHLLAPIRGAPIHFHPQLVGLDQPRRLAQPLAHLRQEEHEAVRPGPVARERGVGLRGWPRSAVARRTSASAAGAFQLCATSGDAWVRTSTIAARTARRTHAPLTLAGGR